MKPLDANDITESKLLELCITYNIRGTLGYEGLVAEANRRGVDVATVSRDGIILQLRKLGIVR